MDTISSKNSSSPLRETIQSRVVWPWAYKSLPKVLISISGMLAYENILSSYHFNGDDSDFDRSVFTHKDWSLATFMPSRWILCYLMAQCCFTFPVVLQLLYGVVIARDPDSLFPQKQGYDLVYHASAFIVLGALSLPAMFATHPWSQWMVAYAFLTMLSHLIHAIISIRLLILERDDPQIGPKKTPLATVAESSVASWESSGCLDKTLIVLRRTGSLIGIVGSYIWLVTPKILITCFSITTLVSILDKSPAYTDHEVTHYILLPSYTLLVTIIGTFSLPTALQLIYGILRREKHLMQLQNPSGAAQEFIFHLLATLGYGCFFGSIFHEVGDAARLFRLLARKVTLHAEMFAMLSLFGHLLLAFICLSWLANVLRFWVAFSSTVRAFLSGSDTLDEPKSSRSIGS